MRKAFASDFDGTIHFWGADELVSGRDRAAITAFREAGGLFGVCTGRTLRGLTKQTAGVIGFDFYIAASGATIFDANLVPILYRTVPRDLVRELYNAYVIDLDTDQAALVCAADDYWCLQQGRSDPMINPVATFDEIPEPLLGFAVNTVTDAEATDMAADINARFGDVVHAYQNLNSIDVVPAGCSKGTGVRTIAEYFGIELMACMGDSFNDVPMLEAADVAYTFPSSELGVRAAADVLAESVAEAIGDFMAR